MINPLPPMAKGILITAMIAYLAVVTGMLTGKDWLTDLGLLLDFLLVVAILVGLLSGAIGG